jgi:adenine-specific DNA-methyltransferase
MPTLDWLNRADAFTTAARVPYRLLEQASVHSATAAVAPSPLRGESLPPARSGGGGEGLPPSPIHDNLLIQGDNLEALKALLPFYRGQVKCIFIDPPYNTKSAFEHYDDNLEHSQWLSMMLPRLQLLRELLREDGSIWVTIDDNEGHYLKVMMDEVFGRRNFVATNVWQKRYSRDNNSAIGDVHDYVLCYAKDALRFKDTRNLIEPDEKTRSAYRNPNSDPRGPWRLVPMSGAELRPNQQYPVKTPNGKIIYPPEGRHWSVLEPKFLELVSEGKVFFGKNGDSAPGLIRYFSEIKGLVPWTWWPHEDVGHTDESKKEIHALFGKSDAFGTPKPERLMKRVLDIATNPGDLVLDSFLGSGTTAAVAHKMGRRWIGIEMGEHAATHCLPRLQKVIDGEQGGISAAMGWQGGGGFRFMRLGAPIFDANGCIHPEVRFATLAAFVWQQETGQAWAAHAARAGTPYLGTHYPIDSSSRPSDAGNVPISLEIVPTDLFSAPTPAAEPQPTLPASTPAPVEAPRQGTAYYLLFNGILGDKRPASGNVLTQAVLDALLELHAQIHGPTPRPAVPLVVYGEACRLGAARLKLANLTFRHIPYDVKAR